MDSCGVVDFCEYRLLMIMTREALFIAKVENLNGCFTVVVCVPS